MFINYKNKRSIIRALVGCLLIASVACSCKKLVEAGQPMSSITTEKTFGTNALADAALAGLYSQMMTNNGNMLFSNGGTTIYTGMSADELVSFAGASAAPIYQFYTNHLLKDNFLPDGLFWQPAYKLIYGANAAIEAIEASTSPQLLDSARNVLTGEAKFIRAFSYFYLTNIYGDVPLVLTTDFTKTVSMARTPKEDVYAQMVLDLKDAQQLLMNDYSTAKGERIRVNKWAATALLARVYLYQQNWAEAETEASAVIGNNQYGLKTNMNDVFLNNSNEAIWQLQQNVTVMPRNATWEAVNFMPAIRISPLSPADQAGLLVPFIFNMYVKSFIPNYYLTSELANAFEPNDLRKSIWVDSTPTPIDTPYNGIAYYYPAKYTTQVATGNAITQYYMVLRLAEQYLIRAEARAQQSKTAEAAADLNVLRTRAGLPNTTATAKTDLLVAVAQERRVELFTEWGHRWFDLKRTGKASEVLGAMPAKQPWSDNSLLYPISTIELSNDPRLQQNPGY